MSHKTLLEYKNNKGKIMPIFYWIIIITFISGVVGTGLGGIIGGIAKNVSKKVIAYLLCFASGVMLSIVCLDLLLESISPTGQITFNFILTTVIGTALGYFIVYFLNNYIDNHNSSGSSVVAVTGEQSMDVRLFSAGLILALAIALHNLPEGLVIGVSYAGKTAISDASGLAIAIIIGLHNIPEGMAVSVPLVASGMKPYKAALITSLSGFPTVLGAMIGFLIGNIGPTTQSLALSFAAGAMLFVVFGELFPEAIELHKSKFLTYFTIIGIIVGCIVIYI